MSVIATAVKHLLAAGVTGDALVTAIEDMEQSMEPVETRSTAAIRQQRYRDNNKVGAVTKRNESVTRNDSNASEQKEKVSPKEYISNPLPKEKSPLTPKGVSSPAVSEAYSGWNDFAEKHNWQQIRSQTTSRTKKLEARLAEHGLEGWREALQRAATSRMLGNDPPGWFNFDFITKNPENILKVLEGNYDKQFGENGRNEGCGPTIAAANKAFDSLEGWGSTGSNQTVAERGAGGSPKLLATAFNR